MYFSAPYTLDNIKKQYRELSKRLHSDKGGSDTEFTLMKYEYDVLLKVIAQQEIKKKVILKVVKPQKTHYHFTTDKNTLELLKSLKKIFK